jgi:hypothetical protein
MIASPCLLATTVQRSLAACVLVGAGGCTDLDPAMPPLRLSDPPDASAEMGDDASAAGTAWAPGNRGLNLEWPRSFGPAGRTVGSGVPEDASSSAMGAVESQGKTESIGRKPLEAGLSLDGEELSISLRNYTGLPAGVLLNLRVDTPQGSHAQSPAGDVLMNGGEERRLTLRASDLEELDITALEWTRLVLQYDFVLQDGRRGSQSTELAILRGRAVATEEAIASGRRLPDLVSSSGMAEEVPPTGAAFDTCFRNIIDLLPQISGELPTACPPEADDPTRGGCLNGVDFMIQNHQVLPLPGQTFSYVAPDGTTSAGSLDASGCTPSLATQPGTWRFKIYLHTQREDPARAVYFLDDDGRLAFAEAQLDVEPSGGRATLDIPVPEAERPFQAAMLLANHTMDRANAINALRARATNVLRISPAATEATAQYCHVAGEGCPGPRTLRVSRDIANDRGRIAHETGHFIHAHHLDCPDCNPPTTLFAVDDRYSNTDAGNPGDTCRRTTLGHELDSVEWQSAAHWEGLAYFFAALSYNDYTEQDCQLPSQVGSTGNVALIDCEAPGRTPLACLEWKNLSFFDDTGNALDWAKMYWDFLTDHSETDWSIYLQAERNVGARWPSDGRDNHFDLIWVQLAALDGIRGANFRESANGNILNGVDR